ncbi:hypothetical protein HWV62_21764 [Athelia sp. TMB]|nr:hypothetical protein HWV62_21764 [Athelia sp. TMB]
MQSNRLRAAAAMMRSNAGNGDAVVIDMGDIGNSDAAAKKKKVDTLFGPNIGVVASGPAWTETDEKDARGAVDELTPEVVKGWIAKSKESSQPTTTLQALVNLKRPTLRLTPLTADDEGEHEHHEHGLEFEYDCDAPRCGIYVSVLLPHDHPDAPAPTPTSPTPASGFARVLVFEHVVDGGFGRHLTLEEGAMLELARYDRPAGAPSTPAVSTAPALAPRPADRKSRRFTNFHIRKRGPALAVVDAAPAAPEASSTPEVHIQDKDGGDAGVKVHIRLAALDAAGAPLAARNEQGTYLHVVRMLPPNASDEERESKPWVVKVVKREAAIGAHTFQLHEIYGLSSQSAPASTPAEHTYPPPVREEEPQSECLLCLSAPRAVVLLPCRHLVACRECALNMVEFGAGGAIVQPEAEAAGPGADGAGEGEAGGEGGVGGGTGSVNVLVAHLVGAPSPAAGTTANVGAAAQAQAARRKRKAKGWFCPVCRQPYTSLLRITTSPPSAPGKDVDNRASTSSDGAGEGEGEGADTVPAAAPRGLAALRPAFLRGISRASAGDAERGEAAV